MDKEEMSDLVQKAADTYKEWVADGVKWRVTVTTYPYLVVSVVGIDNKDFTTEDNNKLIDLLVVHYYGTEERFNKSLTDGSLQVLKTPTGPWFLRDQTIKEGIGELGKQLLN